MTLEIPVDIAAAVALHTSAYQRLPADLMMVRAGVLCIRNGIGMNDILLNGLLGCAEAGIPEAVGALIALRAPEPMIAAAIEASTKKAKQ
jgi:hypothetical protein